MPDMENVATMKPTGTARLGLFFFAFYLFFYAGFVLVSSFAPRVLEHQVAGVTLAVHAGILLILGAMGLAILYCWLSRNTADEQPGSPS